MGNRITICHWNESGSWSAIEISTSALTGHENHEMDIWPPIEGVTSGSNWPRGEAVFLNACVIPATAEPTPPGSPTPEPSLPDTGITLVLMLLLGTLMIAVGMALVRIKRQDELEDG